MEPWFPYYARDIITSHRLSTPCGFSRACYLCVYDRMGSQSRAMMLVDWAHSLVCNWGTEPCDVALSLALSEACRE